MRHTCLIAVAAFVCLTAPLAAGVPARAADEGPAAYAKFTEGLTPQRGLFTVWRGKDGKVNLELSASQLNHDFILSAVPGNGLGGYFMSAGGADYYAPHIIRFERQDNSVAIVYPNTNFLAPSGSAAANAIAAMARGDELVPGPLDKELHLRVTAAVRAAAAEGAS